MNQENSLMVMDGATPVIQENVGVSFYQPMSPALLQKRMEIILESQKLMKEDTHYGVVPGTAGKPSLLKPGAEFLCVMFGLCPRFCEEIKELEEGHREYRVRCSIFDTTGRLIAEGLGSCSTLEKKYRWREAKRKCPECGKEAIIKGKEEYGGGWLCFVKKGGCGAKWSEKDPVIIGQALGEVENPNIADVWNTCLKMAKKRAHVDATLTATGASSIFTQDIEDMPKEQLSGEIIDVTPKPKENLTSVDDEPQAAKRPGAYKLKAQASKFKGQTISAIFKEIGPQNLMSWLERDRVSGDDYANIEAFLAEKSNGELDLDPDCIPGDLE